MGLIVRTRLRGISQRWRRTVSHVPLGPTRLATLKHRQQHRRSKYQVSAARGAGLRGCQSKRKTDIERWARDPWAGATDRRDGLGPMANCHDPPVALNYRFRKDGTCNSVASCLWALGLSLDSDSMPAESPTHNSPSLAPLFTGRLHLGLSRPFETPFLLGVVCGFPVPVACTGLWVLAPREWTQIPCEELWAGRSLAMLISVCQTGWPGTGSWRVPAPRLTNSAASGAKEPVVGRSGYGGPRDGQWRSLILVSRLPRGIRSGGRHLVRRRLEQPVLASAHGRAAKSRSCQGYETERGSRALCPHRLRKGLSEDQQRLCGGFQFHTAPIRR